MKKLTQEEFSSLSLKGRGRSSEIYNSIINLKIGEALLIEPKDWNRKASPSSLVKYIEKTQELKYTYSALANGNGWVIKRVEVTAGPNPLNIKKETLPEKQSINKVDHHKTSEALDNLKAELTIFYLGRITSLKIEKITDSIEAAQEYFRDEPRPLIKKQLEEVISALAKQKHIIIENEKTYVPLKKY